MNIFFTGATGVIGRQTIPRLAEAGHRVTAVARNHNDHHWLRRQGATPVEVDLFDPAAVSAAVDGHEVVVHMATSIPPQDKMSKRKAWTTNDRLRAVATSILVDAALALDVEAFIQQSITFVYADGGDQWLDEDSPVDTVWDVLDSALIAEEHVARFARGGGRGVILRFSNLYGPGPASQDYVTAVSTRKLPIVGSGVNYTSHLHTHDAGTAVTAALRAPTGVFNVTDDTPVTKREELEALAETLAVKPPRKLPRWLVRTIVGPAANMLTVSQRVSNNRFKRATDWTPHFRSVTDGWSDAVRDAGTGSRVLRD